jgi:ribonuclease HI
MGIWHLKSQKEIARLAVQRGAAKKHGPTFHQRLQGILCTEDRCTPKPQIQAALTLAVVVPSAPVQDFNLAQCDTDSNGAIFVYTDGSYDPQTNKAGHGLFFQPNSTNNRAIRTSGHQSNQHAEIQAILSTLLMVPVTTPIHFITDSEYAINAVRRADTWSAAKMANSTNKTTILQVLAEIGKRSKNSIEMQWCKGHSTTFGNNEADALAATAATLPSAQVQAPPPNSSFLLEEGQVVDGNLHQFILRKTLAKHMEEWKLLRLQGHFLTASGVDWTASNFFFLTTQTIATLNMARKIRLGIAPTNAVLMKVHHPNINTDICPFCPVVAEQASIVDDNAHFLLHCQCSLSARIELRTKVLTLINNSIPHTGKSVDNIPFWFDAHQSNVALSPVSVALQNFNKYHGARGLIPAVLHKFLYSLGIKPSSTAKIARQLSAIIIQHSVDLVRYRTTLAVANAETDVE